MTNYLGVRLILESFWGAVENEYFLGNVQKPHGFSAKNAQLFFSAFCRFPHACYGFVQKVRF